MSVTSMNMDEVFRDPLTLKVMQQQVREVNEANGWFDSDRDFAADVALLHTEVSEMFEAYRDYGFDDATATEHYVGVDALTKSDPQPIENPKPEGVGSEIADVLIRLLDTCERQGIDLEFEYRRKLAFNKTRGYRHGGKRV